ncbi:protease inhibitor I42 family protein [Patescibacteria group bacterium]|nr:protease inhibitor I42 family protein [Patescibacteria group bacterium]
MKPRKSIDILLSVITLIFIIAVVYFSTKMFVEGYNEKRVYSLNACNNVCLKKGYSESACLWISEFELGMENVGNCVVANSSHCGSSGQCDCMCSSGQDLKTYAKGIKSELISSKTLNYFYIHTKIDYLAGYDWEVDYDPNYLELLDRVQENKEDLLKSGNLTFQFKALNVGTTKVYLYYKRPWEDEAPKDVRVFEVQIMRFF